MVNTPSPKEDQYKAIIDTQSEMILRHKRDGTIVFVNESFAQFRGLDNKQLIGQKWYPLVSPEIAKMIGELMDAITVNEPSFHIDLNERRFDGEIRSVSWVSTGIFNADGVLEELQVVGRDITERKEMERKLEESVRELEFLKEKYKIVADYTTDMDRWLLPDSSLGYISPNCQEITGYSAEEFMQDPEMIIKIIHPDDKPEAEHNRKEAFRTQQVIQSEYRIITKDKKIKWIKFTGKSVFDKEGHFAGLRVNGRDITDQKNAEERLRLSEARYRAIVNAQSEMIIRHKRDSTILFVNESFAQFYGLDAEQLIGQKWFSFVPPEIVKNTEELMDAMSIDKPVAQIDLEDKRSDGETRNVSWISTGIFNADGVLKELQVVGRDITERKEMEQRLRTAYQEVDFLKEKYETIADFTYSMERWIGEDGTLNYISPSCKRITGYSREEFMESPFLMDNLVIPEDRELWENRPFKNMILDEPKELEYRIRRKDGKVRWLRTIAGLVVDKSGASFGVRSSTRDITKQKDAELALQEAFQEINDLRKKLEQENLYLREKIIPAQTAHGIIANSPAMTDVINKINQVATTDSPVLIIGETGTGKELIANAIHQQSKRTSSTLIVVNCAALPPSLIESELFGREKGAYTGALARQIGRFEMADKSTLLLDEIGELPLEIQVKLLRFLQFGEYQLLGSPQTRKVDVRIIAASNRNLVQAIEKGSFRSDLYYRLNVFPIDVPPLRQRKEDIPSLVWNFVEEISATIGRRIDKIPNKSMDMLLNYSWPGNVRELRNIIEYSLIISQGTTLDIILPSLSKEREQKLTMQEVEKSHIEDVLKLTNGRIRGSNGAAEILGLNESTLRFRMKKLGIQGRK